MTSFLFVAIVIVVEIARCHKQRILTSLENDDFEPFLLLFNDCESHS